MPITAQHVQRTLDAYLAAHPDDKAGLADLASTLEQAGDAIASRAEWRGHVTAGAVLLREDGRVLQIEHRALHRWLLPGGHLEDEDGILMDAALRELTEETGIPAADVTPGSAVPVHVDAHPIPENPGKGEPAHQHFDFRFLFHLETDDAVVLQEEEVTGYAWRTPDDLPEPLRSRVMAAVPA
ncbi:NUDIX hydrolase [Streptomyces abyssomicinicus]|uniref:NUDIX hydrolase n=1 Tax=Streptomyces abyssomicinicus TaxID=574929 RepID=UPI0012505CC0|nr:NUDIX hydrolase [Streptomyces abyssomicinicus]